MMYSLSFWKFNLDSEGVLRGENIGSAGERMEQEVLLVEDVIDPEIEREIFRRVVMHLQVDHEEIIEGPVDVRNDIGVVESRILLSAIARPPRMAPAVVRRVCPAKLGPPVRHERHAFTD